MKTTNKKILTLVMAAAAATPMLHAQDALRSGYFFEGYYNRHELNPAFAPERSYFTIPALGGFTESLNANVGLDAFLYPINVGGQEKLTTFMNPNVNAQDFLGKLKGTSFLSENLSVPIISAGFGAFGGYNTITISANVNANLALPKDLFTFMKLGMTSDDTQYNFSGLGIDASAMAEVALGHSRQVLPQLRVGGKVKFLLGIGNAHGYVDNFTARLSNNEWKITARGGLDVAMGSGFRMPMKSQYDSSVSPEDADLVDWDNIAYDSFGLSGFGMALDLGAVYQLTPDLELSASLLDLGFMSWSNVVRTSTSDTEWSFDGFKDIALDSNAQDYEQNKLGQQFDDLGDQLKDCFDMRVRETGASRTSGIGSTFSLGALYTMPFYRGLKGGFLFTQRINGAYSWTEGRFSANVSPTNWFDAAINYGASSFGSSLGWMINFHPAVVNFFIGADYQFFKVTPQMVPVGKANIALSFGFNWNIGYKKKHELSPLLSSDFKAL